MGDTPLNLAMALVDAQTSVTIGDGNQDSNRITISLTNSGDEAVTFGQTYGSRGSFTMSFAVCTDAQDLLHSLEESVDLAIEAPADWQIRPYKRKDNQAVYEFRLPKQVFGPGESKTLTVRKFACRATPGLARLDLAFAITGYQSCAQTLEVEKRAEVFDLLFFEANPTYIATDEEKRAFTLSWSTLQAGKVVLKKDKYELATFVAGGGDFENGSEYIYRQEHPDQASTVYELTAWDQSDASRKRTIERRVHVLQSGWHEREFRQHGYPAVLCSLDDVDLYAVFIDHGRARLCSSKHPFAVWNLENDRVPEGMSTSPAVGFHNRIWLVGGSSVDPDNYSNRVCSYDPAKYKWHEDEAPWPARMGQACVRFNDSFWVMGGMDTDGNGLRDVYSMDSKGSWQRHDDAPWEPRCMFATAEYRKRIWIYGGCAEPFGDPRTDMWTFVESAGWTRHTDLPSLPRDALGQPISNHLQVVRDRLYLLGSFRSGQTVRAWQCLWNEDQKSWFIQEVTNPWDQQGQNTHSLSGAAFNGLVFLRSLNWQTKVNPTKLYMLKP